MQTRYRTRGIDLSGFDEGVSAIAKAFAPPSPQELLYSAQAAKVRGDTSRIADLYARAADPSVNADVLERQSIIADLFDPSHSFSAVRMNNAAAGQRNAADNARALEQTRLQQAGETERNANTTRGSAIANAYQPLNPGQVRPEVPATIVGAIGLPALPATQGLEKPLSETEVRGLLLRRQPLEVQDAAARSAIPREQVQTPQGPRFVYGSDAVGQAPVLDASGKVQNYATPGGGRGTAVPGPTGRLTDTQTGAELPAGSTVFGAQAQGSPDQFGKTTEAENRDAYAARMTEQATQDILHAFDTGRLPTRGDAALRALAESLPVLVQPELVTSMSPEGQAFYQNVRSALPMQLLTQSGQGVTEREYERKMAELVPVPGETPSVTAAKRRQFATYAAAVQGLAGRALGKVNAVPAQQPGAPAAATGGYPDGTVIENGAGQRMIRRGGKWEAHNG